jgi:hypothetical protein
VSTIEIISFTGVTPYNITICDLTLTYCYVVATEVTTTPITVNIPQELMGSPQLVVKLVDANNCEYFQLYQCLTPTPTPTTTITPTPSMVVNCNCLTFNNLSGLTEYNISLTQCDGSILVTTILPGVILYYCGKLPNADPQVIITIGSPCVNNTCPNPTPTPTNTPTPTPTNTPNLPFLLQENGFYLLQENGFKIKLT